MTEKNVTKVESEEKKLEDRELSSGETKELEREQLEFNSIFEDFADEEEVELKLWNLYMENDQIDECQAKLFFDKVSELKYVPVYKYVIRYLLLRYRLSLGDANKEGLDKYLEEGNPHINMSLGKKEKTNYWRNYREKKMKKYVLLQKKIMTYLCRSLSRG